ncbi:hypothetical protein BJF85_18280 [Saccharomonospora sp. CUA-673]|nr:hypothetical protein BJF85_18280 [Saccharomonospora sp. CUA-673]
MGLFLERGYENVTVEDVAEAVGVSRRTIFRYFDSKDELAFPDHTERIHLVESRLAELAPTVDPVEAVIAATEASLRDFLRRPELAVRRYQLTRIVPQLRDREVIENERYVRCQRAFLREHLPAGSPHFQSVALAALIDGIHRSALGNWVRSEGRTDALAELAEGMEWVRSLVERGNDSAGDGDDPGLLVAVLPDTARTRRTLTQLRDDARENL